MKKYVFSGNTEWLEAVAKKYGDAVAVSSDYGILNAIQNDKESYIIVLHDEEHPMDCGTKKTPYLFNEFRHVKPGALLSDVFLPCENLEVALKRLEERLNRFDTVMQTVQEAEKGTLKVLYDGWSFGGGRDFDADYYKIYDDNGVLQARLTIGTTDEAEIAIYREGERMGFTNHGWHERTNLTIHRIWDQIALKCVKRDDTEICKALTDKNGALCFPRDNEDISREDILNQSWK